VTSLTPTAELEKIKNLIWITLGLLCLTHLQSLLLRIKQLKLLQIINPHIVDFVIIITDLLNAPNQTKKSYE